MMLNTVTQLFKRMYSIKVVQPPLDASFTTVVYSNRTTAQTADSKI